MPRCRWCNPNNPAYVKYHDSEWGVPNFADQYLYEMLILESFQAGLSWECVLNKREDFRVAYENFDLEKVCTFNEARVAELLQNEKIIRNRLKIRASIKNSQIFRAIVNEFGSFRAYLETFTHGAIFFETGKTTSALSDAISNDLKSRGMTFVGSTTIYAFLQAIGVIFAHEPGCDLYKNDIIEP